MRGERVIIPAGAGMKPEGEWDFAGVVGPYREGGSCMKIELGEEKFLRESNLEDKGQGRCL